MTKLQSAASLAESIFAYTQSINASVSEQKNDISNIKGHIEVLNSEMGQVVIAQKEANKALNTLCTTITEVKNDVSWLKQFFWLIATASIGGLIMGVLNLIVKK